MTDQMIEMLIQQRRIDRTLEVTFATAMLIALAIGVHIVVTVLRRRTVSAKLTAFAVCAFVVGVLSETARVNTERRVQQSVERAIQPNSGTSNKRVPSDIVALFR